MSIAYKISALNREKKWRLFNKLLNPAPTTTILDVGFSENEYSKTDNFLEKNYPYPHNITALGIDTPKKFLERYPRVKALKYDGKKFPFDNKEFDICWSNAVIEHVGDTDAQIFFLKEIQRVAKRSFITTPNKYFPIEVHTHTPLLHFLPKRIFDKYLSLIGKRWATGNYMNLLALKELKTMLHHAGISTYKIIRNKFLFFTLDFIIYIKDRP
ncbi:MAG TPA: class I SAM-dependent methyltransferase [bacterium]|nr:class I SAM-dependent methyltransferase [bacterium]HPL95826.1 class I SAM-dependent methyltransferase [bacterium]